MSVAVRLAYGFSDGTALAAGGAGGRAGRDRRIDELAPQLSHVHLVVTATTPGLDIRLDGTALGSATWGAPVPVDPGDHEIRAARRATLPGTRAG